MKSYRKFCEITPPSIFRHNKNFGFTEKGANKILFKVCDNCTYEENKDISNKL